MCQFISTHLSEKALKKPPQKGFGSNSVKLLVFLTAEYTK